MTDGNEQCLGGYQMAHLDYNTGNKAKKTGLLLGLDSWSRKDWLPLISTLSSQDD